MKDIKITKKEEIIAAAQLLKVNCDINCDCPFSIGNICIISEYETPAEWNLEEINGK